MRPIWMSMAPLMELSIPGKDFKVVIEAHADEISWFVNHISKDGFIHVIRNGGSDYVIAPSKKVNIHTSKGIVEGVFGWPAIHTRHGDGKVVPKLENIFIDVGAKNKEEVLEMGIHVGCVITFTDELWLMNEKFYTGRALDNRMGGFCIAQGSQNDSTKKGEVALLPVCGKLRPGRSRQTRSRNDRTNHQTRCSHCY